MIGHLFQLLFRRQAPEVLADPARPYRVPAENRVHAVQTEQRIHTASPESRIWRPSQ